MHSVSFSKAHRFRAERHCREEPLPAAQEEQEELEALEELEILELLESLALLYQPKKSHDFSRDFFKYSLHFLH